jgi:hypothetical protein
VPPRSQHSLMAEVQLLGVRVVVNQKAAFDGVQVHLAGTGDHVSCPGPTLRPDDLARLAPSHCRHQSQVCMYVTVLLVTPRRLGKASRIHGLLKTVNVGPTSVTHTRFPN